MRKILITILLFILFSLITFGWLSFSKNKNSIQFILKFSTIKLSSIKFSKLQTKASSAKIFVKQKNLEPSFCFLIDMSLPANRRRFFVYDLSGDSILNSGLVAHGNCNQYWLTGRKYSNDVGGGCTSLGKYKIGNFYEGRFGSAFKLYGLDSSNSNAFKRYVVLHSHSCVPENETEDNICQSNGCPTVSPNFLKSLEPMIKNAKKPVLLWIFE